MSTAAIIAIALGVVVVLGAISFFTLARRSDVRGAGALSGETVHRDKAARKSAEPGFDADHRGRRRGSWARISQADH